MGWRVGLGLAVAVMLVILSPLSAASTVIAPPYKGYFSGGTQIDGGGCSSDKVRVAPAFNLSSGIGGLGVTHAQSKVCRGSAYAGIGATSFADVQGSVAIEIKFTGVGGYHTLTPRVLLTWAFAGNYSNGSGCPSPSPFHFSYSNAPPHSTYSTWYNVTGAQSFCYATVGVSAYVSQVSLVDLTNGTLLAPSWGCSYCLLFQKLRQSYFDSGWEFYNSTTYSNGNWSYSSGVSSLNSSSATPTALVTSGSTHVRVDFNYTFVKSHTYALAFYAFSSVDVTVGGFVGGSAQGTLDTATSGNGLSIPRLVAQ